MRENWSSPIPNISSRRRTSNSTRKIGVSKKILVKSSTKSYWWRNCENSWVLLSIRSQDRKLIEDQNTILELSGRVQESQNEANCINDSQDFQDGESIQSGNSHVTSQPMSFPPHPIPEGMLRHSFVSPRRKEGPPSIWDTHGISGNVVANPHSSSSALYPQELNPWWTTIEEPLHMSTAEKSERPEQNRDLRCQSGTVSQNFCLLQWVRFFKETVGQTNNDCRFRISILTSYSGPFCWSCAPNIGATLMRFTWTNATQRRILVSNFGMTCK